MNQPDTMCTYRDLPLFFLTLDLAWNDPPFLTLGLSFSAAFSISVNGSVTLPLLVALSKPLFLLRGSSLLSLRLLIAEGTPGGTRLQSAMTHSHLTH